MKPQVLVVDDSMTVRMDLRRTMSAAGFVVTACETKAVAQKVLRGKAFSLAILDLILPDGDGIDLLWDIRASQDHERMPVILLTTEVEVRHRIHGLSSGADEYIGKPYDHGYLVLRACELVRQHGAAPDGPSVRGRPLAGRKLLVVDDSPTYLTALAQVLREDGCEVIAAHSGEEALDLLKIEPVDCVIMDLLMPGIGGMEAARRIKGDPATWLTPVLILTGHDDSQARAEGAEIGVDDYLIKSPELHFLKARLRAVIRPRATERPRASDDAPPSSGLAPSALVPGSLFQRVLAASGLSSVIGPSTLSRACRRAGVEPGSMSPEDLDRALPAIQETLRVFLHEDEHRRRFDAIAALARSTPLTAALALGLLCSA
jgi:DNA-binding response OmpR family regulator